MKKLIILLLLTGCADKYTLEECASLKNGVTICFTVDNFYSLDECSDLKEKLESKPTENIITFYCKKS